MNKKNFSLYVATAFMISLAVGALITQNCAKARFDRMTSDCTGSNCNNTGFSVKWNFDIEWGECSAECGGGTQTREVYCEDASGNRVDESRCSSADRPAEQRVCNVHSCDSLRYVWVPGAWGTCTGGTQTRTIACYDTQTSTEVDDSNCTQTPPETSRSCTATTAYTYIQDIPDGNADVDILLILDDSASMEPEQMKIANRLGGFVGDLDGANIDWQMCITTTDIDFYQGRAIVWEGLNNHILKKADGNRDAVFRDTITKIGAGFSNDEQGIKAAYLAVEDNTISKCMRDSAALVVIILSDEDERSVGGVRSRSSAQYQPLGPKNMPTEFIEVVQNTFSSNTAAKRLIVNSIIVRPGDTVCETNQDNQGVPSFFGTKYDELSRLTGGYVGDICANDYRQNLKFFQNNILNQLSKVDLTCDPKNITVMTIPNVAGINYTVNGNEISFVPPIPGGTRVIINYECDNP